MKRILIFALLVATSACESGESKTTPLPFPDDPTLWPGIRAERIRTLLGPAMDRGDIDAWVVFARENANDPLALHIGAENAGGLAAFLFFRNSDNTVETLALSPVTESTALSEVTPLDSVHPFPRGSDIFALVGDELRSRNSQRIGINSGPRSVADGLSYTQRVALERALGPVYSNRLVPSAPAIVQWMSVKLPAEVDVMRRAAELTEQLELEAYEQVIPGQTTDADVARFLKRRMSELGVRDGWAADQNPNVNSGPDRGHSHSTEKVIQAGDIIQTDFGIQVHGIWVTDIQRFAYVLHPNETAPPAEMQQRWENARRGGQAAFEAMAPGKFGWEVDLAQRVNLEASGSIPIIWSTGHPVGYWAHDLGPRLGGAAGGDAARGDATLELRPGQTFAFDGFFGWAQEDGTTKTISVEEMVVITAGAAEYLIPPQQELVLIPSR
jgi:Xaa-Pro dipeptidase